MATRETASPHRGLLAASYTMNVFERVAASPISYRDGLAPPGRHYMRLPVAKGVGRQNSSVEMAQHAFRANFLRSCLMASPVRGQTVTASRP